MRPAIERLPLCGPGCRPFTSRSPGEAACTPIDHAALDCSSGTSTRVRAACGACEERGRSALPPLTPAPLPYLRVWLRDVLGALDDQHGPGQDARIGRRAVTGVGEAPVLRQALSDHLLR